MIHSMKTSKIFLLGFLFIVPVMGIAQTPDSLFLKANQSYTKGNFAQAVEYYQQIIVLGFESPELYLNLGNSYFREQDYGRARLYYEKAKNLDPYLTGLNENLDLIQTFLVDKITVLPQIEVKNDTINLLRFYNSWISFAVILVFSCFSGYLVFKYFKIKLQGKHRYLFITMLSVTLLLQVGVFSYLFLDYSTESAIVTQDRVDVKSEPDNTGTTIFTLHLATKIFIKNSYEGWYFIQLENGNTGWLEAASVEKI